MCLFESNISIVEIAPQSNLARWWADIWVPALCLSSYTECSKSVLPPQIYLLFLICCVQYSILLRQMEDECAEDYKHTGDELEINNSSSDITNTENTYMESDSINYKSLIEI